MTRFHIDTDIRRARTLASDFYTDEQFFELSKENIFARSWQFLGRGDGVNVLKPMTILPGLLNEPVLLVNENGDLKCLSNVCTHRGKILVEEECEANLIRCSYHGRRFSLDGRMLSMPEFEGVQDFPSPSDDLYRYQIEEFAGFKFASSEPFPMFGDLVDGLSGLFDDVNIRDLQLAATREYEVNAHWALYCENFLEGFHVPYVHPSLNEVVDYGTYITDTFRYSSLQTAYTDGTKSEVAARFLYIFPNTMLNFYPWGISVNIVKPQSPTKTIVEFLTYVSDAALLGEGAGADLHKVEMEDEAVVESVQKGIRSRYYSQGRYSPSREQGTHHFHRLIAEFMGGR
ncbi:MAG: aromatic ring-hydroxylating dioxygenase subunit alpha [Pyrinomonadaceae bacterium]